MTCSWTSRGRRQGNSGLKYVYMLLGIYNLLSKWYGEMKKVELNIIDLDFLLMRN